MGALTVAELVTLAAAIIGQGGTVLKLVEDLHAQGVLPAGAVPTNPLLHAIATELRGLANQLDPQ